MIIADACRKILLLLVLVCSVWSVSPVCALEAKPSRALPVFPGAQGFGTETPAGRGGAIIRVTNLDDSGSGSLRAAIERSGPRIIVFEVGGTIDLKKELRIKDPFITIAGQTAPSPGITLKGAGLFIQTHDVLVQHLRIRVGDELKGPDPISRDGLKVSGRGADVYNVVCDHLSISWATDEVVSTVYGPSEVTISNSIISEGLQDSIHPQGTHSKALLVREGTRNLALIGNLFAHNHDRNPRIAGNSSVIMVNNLLYNTGKKYWIELDKGRGKTPQIVSVVGNVFVPGPDTPQNAGAIRVRKDCLPGTKVYHSENRAAGPIFMSGSSFDPLVSSPPVWHSSIHPRPATEVEFQVLSRAGARPADRDMVDRRIVREMRIRGGAIISSVSKAGGWSLHPAVIRAFSVPADPGGDRDGDGYTNIEEVLHKMAQELEGERSLKVEGVQGNRRLNKIRVQSTPAHFK